MDSKARELAAAVEAGDFEAIPELATSYRRSVVRGLAHRADLAERRALLLEARTVLNSSLQLAKARRAHLAARLRSATASESSYLLSRTSVYTWEIEA